MHPLVSLVVLVGVATAAPQAVYKNSAAPFKPAAYTAPRYPSVASGYPFPAPGYPYAAAAYPYADPAYPFARPSVYTAPKPVAIAAPAAKPYATPAYVAPYNPQYPSQYVKPIAIVRQSQDDNFDGSFTYEFEAENGIASQASGYVKNAGTDAEAQVIQGQYSYISPDGTPIVTYYFADENGFHVQGDHLPVAPPVPDAIAKSLAYQASLPAPAPAPIVPAVYKKQ